MVRRLERGGRKRAGNVRKRRRVGRRERAGAKIRIRRLIKKG